MVLILAYKNIRPLDATLEQCQLETNKLICIGLIAIKDQSKKVEKRLNVD